MITRDSKIIGEVFQNLFIKLRSLAYSKEEHDVFADFSDRAEYLGGLVAEPTDKTDAFQRNLESLAEDYDCQNVIVIFNR